MAVRRSISSLANGAWGEHRRHDNDGMRLEAIGPAAKAGIAVGDVITSVDDEPIKRASDLARKVTNSAPGTLLRLGVLHHGERKTARVTLDEMPTLRNAPSITPPAR